MPDCQLPWKAGQAFKVGVKLTLFSVPGDHASAALIMELTISLLFV